ncbi:hypothetical protein ACFE04_021535 [Oxalis oulophora]
MALEKITNFFSKRPRTEEWAGFSFYFLQPYFVICISNKEYYECAFSRAHYSSVEIGLGNEKHMGDPILTLLMLFPYVASKRESPGAKISLTSDRCERKYRCRCRFRWVAQLASYFVRPHVHQNVSFSHSPLSHSATIIDTTPSTCFKFAKIRPFVIRSVAKISFYELDSIQAKLPPLLRPPRIHLRCRAATDGEIIGDEIESVQVSIARPVTFECVIVLLAFVFTFFSRTCDFDVMVND